MRFLQGRRLLLLLTAVLTSALLLVGAGSAGATTVGGAPRNVGVEYIHGVSHSLNVTGVTVKAQGVVNATHGFLPLGGPGGAGTVVLKFKQGTLKIHHDAGTQDSNQVGCTESFSVIGSYWVGGGTGAFDDASGYGSFAILQVATFPKGKKGCEFNQKPLRSRTVFSAAGPMFVS